MPYTGSLLARPPQDKAVTLDEGGAPTGGPPKARSVREPDKGSPKRMVVATQGALARCLAAVHASAIQRVRFGPPQTEGGREAPPIGR